VRVIAVLAERGYLAAGALLEVVPSSLPPDAASRDPRAFRARVGEPASPRRSLIWELDGRAYSPTELTCKLAREYGVGDRAAEPSYYSHWRVVGAARSLWDEARAESGAAPNPADM
jgi:hypothetical protein